MAASPITQLLNDWKSGSRKAGDELAPLVYDELHQMAERIFRRERAGHTLQATVLVHDVFANLVDADVDWQSRAHFYAIAARMMRRLLVNYATARVAGKRGGNNVRVTLAEPHAIDAGSDAELLDLDEAISELARVDERKAELVQLKYFGGLSFDEMAEVTALSSSTIDRELRFARAWLKDRLSK
jgi:RNA polymerase sigma factor (TIGR02999 family)